MNKPMQYNRVWAGRAITMGCTLLGGDTRPFLIRHLSRSIQLVSSQPLQPTKFPHLGIKINIFFHTQESNYGINSNSRSNSKPALCPLPFLSLDSSTTATTHVIARGRLSYDDVQEAVGKLIRNHLRGDKRSQAAFPNSMGGDEFVCTPVIKLLWDQVLKATGISNEEELNRMVSIKHFELTVNLNIRIGYYYTYIFGKGRMAMATSGFRMMKFCGDVAATETSYPCAICSKEIVGAMAFRLPCTHLFHAECIVKRLRKSHRCPTCYYEMPTKK
ncbi:uncharacterized protein LOC125219694 [Salvia hispanica]|uniref:uncharacterized protein LOC125219694 n=1 Tax=Salvia hispanica TaxID=49212 RepID=UPI0020095A8D|nr:uncharacterized protein LOC125219694 [Salvia hispanica]XP_047977704.1 uncharacterized protein LOC125219694 [Salvia hispanica]